MTSWNIPPAEIERRSMALIDAEAGDHGWPADQWRVVRRMIHTTADFHFARNARFSPQAMSQGIEALRHGCAIYTDTNMAKAGISQTRIERWGCTVHCLMGEEPVAHRAQEMGITRASAAVDLALQDLDRAIYVVGNAPTALFSLLEHMEAGRCQPALVIGIPVGFVNAAESKEALSQSEVAHITVLGRKGGSAVAASAVNVLAELAGEDDNHGRG